MAKKTSAKPKGLSIARSAMKFACSWKKGESYSNKQQFAYLVNRAGKSDKWSKAVDIGKAVTSRSVSLSLSNYFPHSGRPKITEFKFRVRGLSKDKKWSDWVSKDFEVKLPAKPSLSANPSEESYNQCTFSWSVDTSDTHKVFTDVEFQTKLVTNYDYGGNSGWSTDTGGASGSKTYTESASTIASGAHTRWFRVRARGPRGVSDWRYASRVYSNPYAATNVKGEVTRQAGGMQTKVTWSQTKNSSYPVESQTAEYAIQVPGPGLSYNGNPDGTIGTVTGAGGAASAFISESLDKDECLFVRVTSSYKFKTASSEWVVADTGYLKDPVITDVQPDETTHRVLITASNTSDVPDAFIVVLYRAGSAPDKVATVGVIPAGETQTTVQCPDWSEEPSHELGIYACVGSFTELDREDSVDSFSVDARMKSEKPIWQGGQIPNAPTNVSVNATAISGTVKVVWDWTWTEAQSAVIAWADHEDAWESTEEPETYTINNTHAAEWNVSGLETGKRWYFRVRLVKGSGENGVYGAWSQTASIDLSSAPGIPSLSLSQSIIPKDGSVSAFWAYVSGDGTAQAYAEICEARMTGEGIRYGETIASTETAQHITLYAEELGWDTGETHYLYITFYDSDNDGVPDAINIGGSNVTVLGNRSLADIASACDVAEEDRDYIRQHFKMDEDGFTVSENLNGSETGVRVVLKGDRLSFYHGPAEVAYISDQRLYISQSVVLQQMDVGIKQTEVDIHGDSGKGQWSWKVHENANGENNLYLKWLG